MVKANTEAKKAQTSGNAAGKKGKAGPLERMVVRVSRLALETTKALAILDTWKRAATDGAAAHLTTAVKNSDDVVKTLGFVLTSLNKLGELKFAPANVIAGRKPKFAVGARVKVNPEKLADYTKRGLYDAKDLADLTITAIAGSEARAKIGKTEREVHIRSVNHLVEI